MASVKTNLAYNVTNNVLRVLFPLITAPYVTRVLSPADLGLYAFGFSVATYFALFAALGIPYYGAREIAKVKDNMAKTNRLFSELFSIAVIATLLMTVFYMACLLCIGQFQQQWGFFLLVGMVLYCSPFNIDWFYEGTENFKAIAIRSVVVRVLSLIMLFALVRTKDDLLWYAIITILSVILSDIWNFVVLIREGYSVKLKIRGLKHHMKPLVLLFVSTIAASVYTMFDRVMLGILAPYQQVAFYHYAMEITKILLMAITSLSVVVLPRISSYVASQQRDKSEQLIQKSCSLVIFFSIPIAMGMIILAPVGLPLFLGDHYMASVLPLQILSCLLIFIGLNNIFAVQCLVAFGFDRLFLYSILTGAVTNFALNLFLIPNWGAIGASVASAVAELFVLVVAFYYVYHRVGLRLNVSQEFIITFFTVLVFLPIYYLLSPIVSGWGLVICFAVAASFMYLTIQYYAKNSTLLILAEQLHKVFPKCL